jgi:Helix-turn-helix domain
MTTMLTKRDVEEALRHVLESHSPWLDTEQAATYLTSTPGTLRSWRATGTGPRYHVIHGKTVRYNVADLDAFVRGEDAR